MHSGGRCRVGGGLCSAHVAAAASLSRHALQEPAWRLPGERTTARVSGALLTFTAGSSLQAGVGGRLKQAVPAESRPGHGRPSWRCEHGLAFAECVSGASLRSPLQPSESIL